MGKVLDILAALFATRAAVAASAPAAVVLPLVLEEPGEWNDGDRQAWHDFLDNNPTGRKLRRHLIHSIYDLALTPGLLTDYKQGERDGRNRTLAMLEGYAVLPDAESEDAASTTGG